MVTCVGGGAYRTHSLKLREPHGISSLKREDIKGAGGMSFYGLGKEGWWAESRLKGVTRRQNGLHAKQVL